MALSYHQGCCRLRLLHSISSQGKMLARPFLNRTYLLDSRGQKKTSFSLSVEQKLALDQRYRDAKPMKY